MNARTTRKRAACGWAIAGAWLVALAGCGGGSEAAHGPAVSTSSVPPPAAPTKAAAPRPVDVSTDAREKFTQAAESFRRYEDQHQWNADRCREVAALFEEAAEEMSGGFPEALLNKGIALQRCNDNEGAVRAFQRALESSPNFAPARVQLGLFAYKQKRAGDARQLLTQAISSDPQNVEAYVNLALVQRDANEVQPAIDNLRRALAIDAQFMPAFNLMALIYLDQAQDDSQKLRLAGVVCRQAQQIDANYAPLYNTWGLINLREGNLIAALAKFQRAFTLDANFFEAHMNFGAITLGFRGYEDSRTAFRRAVEIAEARGQRSYEATVGLGVALRGLNQAEQAKAQYERAIAIDGNRPDAYFNLGVLYQDYMGGDIPQLERAKGYYQQFIQKAAGQAQYAQSVSQAQVRTRNADTAIGALRQAAEMQQQAARMQQQQQQQQQTPTPAAVSAPDAGASPPNR